MNPNTLRLITVIIGICTLLSGLGAYADLIPAEYVKVFGLIMIAALSLKEWAVRAGDLLDDGELNGSFKPQEPAKDSSKKIWMGFLLFAASVFLASCSGPAQDALKKRAEEAALEIGTQVTATGIEGTLTWLRKELKTLEAKPVDEDPYQQLIDQNRISALKAAIKQGEAQLAKLRTPSAKQPININPSAQSSVLSAQIKATVAPAFPKIGTLVAAHLSASH